MIATINRAKEEKKFKLSIAIPIAVAMVKSRCDEQATNPTTEVNLADIAADAADMAGHLIKEIFGRESPID